MNDLEQVYVVIVHEPTGDRLMPVRAVFADAWNAIKWVKEQHPDLENRALHDQALKQGLVYLGESNTGQAAVYRMPLQ